ncbi:MAG: MBL fold metallo-hydrolase [Oscillibacter sp.]
MKLTFVNVGYGEAMVLECPDSSRPEGVFTLVLDGGSAEAAEYARSDTGRIPLADYLAGRGIGHIDLMVLTHIHEDHLCGLLPVARALPPRVLWQPLPEHFDRKMQMPDLTADTPSQKKFLQALSDYRTLCTMVEAAGGEVHAVQAGEICCPCPGLTLRILAPGGERLARLAENCAALYRPQTAEDRKKRLLRLDAEMNNFSLILQLEYRGTRILLPGDTNCLGYGDLSRETLRADLFKIGHHGQKDSATEDLLRAISPAAVVCCASSDRRYHSADAGILQMARACGAALYFSDCPAVPEIAQTLPAHQALEFTVGEQGTFTARYIS